MEMEMSAVRAVIAAISSAPTYCLSEHRRRGGGMDRVLSLIGSKSKPPPLSLSFPASAGQSEARSVDSNLKVRYLKVTAATADIQEGISSFCSGFSFFIRFCLLLCHFNPRAKYFTSYRLCYPSLSLRLTVGI